MTKSVTIDASLRRRRPIEDTWSAASATSPPVVIKLIPLDQLPPDVTVHISAGSTMDPPLRGGGVVPDVSASVFLWYYASALSLILGTWVVYLMLPKGARKAYCRSQRRRYTRNQKAKQRSFPPVNVTSVPSVDDSILQGVEQNRRREEEEVRRKQLLEEYYNAREESTGRRSSPSRDKYTPPPPVPFRRQSSFARKMENSYSSLRTPPRNGRLGERSNNKKEDDIDEDDEFVVSQRPETNKLSATATATAASSEVTTSDALAPSPPSPRHPALPRVPDTSILEESMRRLRARGVRLMAHGVQCEPKRVWLRLDLEEPPGTLEWRTEFPRNITDQSGETSIVLMRGAAHRIALPNILYVDVGKKTAALIKAKHVPAAACFSLLTQTGSLDLQTNSKLERDALVSCWSMILDQVHPQHDWRRLYEQSPAPSAAAVSNISSTAFPNMNAVEI